MIVATASASKDTKALIYESLKLNNDTYIVSKSPDRMNLTYCVQYTDKDTPLETLFSEIIENVKSKGIYASRTIIYCQTRKQCAILYRVFETNLGTSFYKDAVPNCKKRLVEMYHAGTPKAVKQHISKNLSSDEGHIRILIATIAFGMGIDCKQVNRFIHFGPSKNIECYIQESGRAGRDGSQSECILLFNGLLSSHCSQDMKDLLHPESGCIRELIMKTFGFTPAVGIKNKHTFCDKCAEKCSCGEEDCKLGLGLKFHDGTVSINEAPRQTRPVSQNQKKLLERELKSFRDNLIREHKEKVLNTVSQPTSLLEFRKLQILSIIKNCHKIFTISDVMQYVEVWRKSHAFGILSAINDVFNDSDIPVSESLFESDETIGDMDWEEIHDDSTLFSVFDSDDESMEVDEILESGEGSLNNSSFFLNLAINS